MLPFLVIAKNHKQFNYWARENGWNEDIKNYNCLHVGKWLHQNKSIDGMQSSYRDNYYFCLHRDYHGCPDEPKVRAKKT